MASPQRENGFTGIAHEILEQLACRKFTGTEFNVLMVVFRSTYGYNKKSHEMALSFISEATGIKSKKLSPIIKKLIKSKVLVVISESTLDHKSRELMFNKDYEQWEIESRELSYPPTEGQQLSPHKGTAKAETIPIEGDSNYPHTGGLKKKGFKESSNSSTSDKEIFEFYRMNLQAGVTESPFNYQQIGCMIDESGSDLVLAAMKLAAQNEKKGTKYTQGILKKWEEAGVKTLDDARSLEKQFREQIKTKFSAKGHQRDNAIKYNDLDVED